MLIILSTELTSLLDQHLFQRELTSNNINLNKYEKKHTPREKVILKKDIFFFGRKGRESLFGSLLNMIILVIVYRNTECNGIVFYVGKRIISNSVSYVYYVYANAMMV